MTAAATHPSTWCSGTLFRPSMLLQNCCKEVFETEGNSRKSFVAVATRCKTAKRLIERDSHRNPLISNKDICCPGGELNTRHTDFQSVALPTELPGRAAMPAYRRSVAILSSRASESAS